jgi:hypothetical protein
MLHGDANPCNFDDALHDRKPKSRVSLRLIPISPVDRLPPETLIYKQPSGWAKNACIEERTEPLSSDKLRDTVHPNLRGVT